MKKILILLSFICQFVSAEENLGTIAYDFAFYQNKILENNSDAIPITDIHGKKIDNKDGLIYEKASPYFFIVKKENPAYYVEKSLEDGYTLSDLEPDDKYLYGIMNKEGRLLLEANKIEIKVLSSKWLGVLDKKLGLMHLFDYTGTRLNQCEYILGVYFNHILQCRNNLLDLNTGKIIASGELYDFINSDFQYGLIIVDENASRKQCLLNTKGEKIISCYKEIKFLNNTTVAFLADNGFWGLYGITGKLLVEPQYDEIYGRISALSLEAQSQFATYQLDGNWGILNEKGEEITPPKYKDINKTTSPTVVELEQTEGSLYLDLQSMEMVDASELPSPKLRYNGG